MEPTFDERLARPAGLGAPLRVLGIWAHPDDEAYLSAGLMHRVVRAGGTACVVTLTDGEAGFPDDDARSAGVRKVLRRGELRAAMAEIGVGDVRCLGLPDGGVADADPSGVAASLGLIFDEIRPDLTVTFGPDGITGHPDHVACWRAATGAWLARSAGQLWYAAKTVEWLDEWRAVHDRLGMWMGEEPAGVPDAAAHATLELSAAETDAKRAVLAAHASQTAAVVDVFGEGPYRRWIAAETFRPPSAGELGGIGSSRALVAGAG